MGREPPVWPSPSGRAWLIALVLSAATLAVFAPVGHYDVGDFDDRDYVVENVEVARGLTWHGVAWAFTAMEFANWFPLTWLSFMADVELFGADPGKHHLINVLFHLANTLLLFGWLTRATRSIWPSAFVAAVFAVHPLHVEPVAWIAQRKEVLCAFFGFLSIWAYVVYAERPRIGRYLLVLFFFALGLMSKPMLVTLPFVLLLLDVWPLGRAPGFRIAATAGSQAARPTWLELVREKLPLLALSLASSVVTFVAQQRGGAVAALGDVPLALRLSNVAVSYLTYIAKAIWPTQLAILYPYPESLPGWEVLGAVLLLIGISALVVRVARERPYLLVGWFWYLGMLVPVIGLVQVGSQSRADRYTYLPLIGLSVVLAWGARELTAGWTRRKWLLGAAATLAIAACVVVARAQVAYWKDTITVWSRALDVTIDNAIAHNNLGVALGLAGKRDEASAHFSEAIRIAPGYADAHYNLGNHLLKTKQIAQARRHYSEAVRIQPERASAHFGLAVCLVAANELAQAVREMTEAIRLEPGNANFHYNLAIMLSGQGRRSAAVHHLEKALSLDPDHPAARREIDALRGDGPQP